MLARSDPSTYCLTWCSVVCGLPMNGGYDVEPTHTFARERLGLLERFHPTLKSEDFHWKIYAKSAQAHESPDVFRRPYDDIHPHGSTARCGQVRGDVSGRIHSRHPEAAESCGARVWREGPSEEERLAPVADALRRCSASSASIRHCSSCAAHRGGAGATVIDAKRGFTYFT